MNPQPIRESRPAGNQAAITKLNGARSEAESNRPGCRCRRCGAHLMAERSVAHEIGPICRRQEMQERAAGGAA